MGKMKLDFSPAEYATVAERITLFYERHPRGRILTRIVSRDDEQITIRATVYRDTDETRASASGLASERFGDDDVNAVACVENTETSAIGRALANLGFTASSKRPSYEEMLKADRARSRIGIVREMASMSSDEKQQYTNAVSDFLQLVSAAERHGMRSVRADAIRNRLQHHLVTPHALARSEARLRRWIDRQVGTQLKADSAT